MTKINNFYIKLFDLTKRYWGVILTLALIGLVVSVIGGLFFGWAWTGFGASTTQTITKEIPGSNPPTTETIVFQQGKSFWDLLSLIIVPAALVLGAFLLSRAQREYELKIADDQHKQERSIANDREEERALQSYLDVMTELLLEKNLGEPEANPHNPKIANVARVRTLTVLPRLNETRKASVLRFLYEAWLIRNDKPSVGLERADLRGADLSRANLHRANLHKVDLNGANLSNAYLGDANLSKADLREAALNEARLVGADLNEANLRNAHLRNAKLYGANLSNADLSEANLSGADLGAANLDSANLSGADMNEAKLSRGDLRLGVFPSQKDLRKALLSQKSLGGGANLHKANLRSANLSNTELGGINLSGANLSGANLSGANLIRANLVGADLGEAILSQADLERATYNNETKWPSGFDPKAAGAINVDEKGQ